MADKTATKRQTLDQVLKDLGKYTPEGALHPVLADAAAWDKVPVIPTSSHVINYLLSVGGWFTGRLHEFFGPEHGGKSTLAIMALMDCYRHYGGDRRVAFIDVEHRFNPEWARSLGMDIGQTGCVWLKPTNAEEATDMMHDLVSTGEIAAIVYDSIGASAARWELDTFEDRAAGYGGAASVMSRNVRTMSPLCDLFETTAFYTNQIRADMEGYNRIITPGGHTLKHQMSLRLYIRKGKEKIYDKTSEGTVEVGYPMVLKAVKNSFGPTPREQWSDFYYVPKEGHGVGFDTSLELQRLGILTGVIRNASSWYYFGEGDDEIKGNGREAFFKALTESGRVQEIADKVMAKLGNSELDGDSLPDELARPAVDGPEVDDPDA